MRTSCYADKTVVDAAENIRIFEDDVMTTLENDNKNVDDHTNIRLALENIRRTAEYASDIAEVAINDTIDNITENHTATAEANNIVLIVILMPMSFHRIYRIVYTHARIKTHNHIRILKVN